MKLYGKEMATKDYFTFGSILKLNIQICVLNELNYSEGMLKKK